MERHAGKLEVLFGPTGKRLVQRGKDLTGVRTVIGTGGTIIYSGRPREILERALFRETDPFVLKPVRPSFYLDERYILYAVGLLGQAEPEKALLLAKKYLIEI